VRTKDLLIATRMKHKFVVDPHLEAYTAIPLR
jgi:hypothetical protein